MRQAVHGCSVVEGYREPPTPLRGGVSSGSAVLLEHLEEGRIEVVDSAVDDAIGGLGERVRLGEESAPAYRSKLGWPQTLAHSPRADPVKVQRS